MATSHTLHASARSIVGKKNSILRRAGEVPGVVYGHGDTNLMVSVAGIPLTKVFSEAGESSLVDLVIAGAKPTKVLIHDIQRDPLTSAIIHVDFYRVSMTEKLTTDVPLVFSGEAKAVKELGGVLVKAIDHLKVECLPQDLVPEIIVDITHLAVFGDSIHVKDIVAPSGVTILSHADDMVATVQQPRAEEEVKVAEAAPVDVSAVEVEKKGKEVKGEKAEEEPVKAEAKK